MTTSLPIYLHVLRKRSGLSQDELAFLLRTSIAMLSKLERLERRPAASVVIGIEIIFGASSRDAFPSLYEQVEAKIMKQGGLLYERLEIRKDEKSKEKCRMLLNMIQRIPPHDADV